MPRSASSKILSREEIAEICRALKAQGKIIGFTSGAFDILHAGHADYLERARALCDCLVVAVNTDDSVRQYKGPARPIMPQEHRAALIAALECVDYVFLFAERRNAKNIEIIQPDFYIKAGDYTPEQLTSASVAEQHGGKIVLLPIEHPVSTSQIIQKIQFEVQSPPLKSQISDQDSPSLQHPDQSHRSDPSHPSDPSSAAS